MNLLTLSNEKVSGSRGERNSCGENYKNWLGTQIGNHNSLYQELMLKTDLVKIDEFIMEKNSNYQVCLNDMQRSAKVGKLVEILGSFFGNEDVRGLESKVIVFVDFKANIQEIMTRFRGEGEGGEGCLFRPMYFVGQGVEGKTKLKMGKNQQAQVLKDFKNSVFNV
jgi:ERCC4-related helicase